MPKASDFGAIDLDDGQVPPETPADAGKPADGGAGDGQPTGGKDGEGKGDAPQTLKIGDKEYTAEQIAELELKASGYAALLPEFTIRSQRLAELEKGHKGEQPKPEDVPFYMKEGWQPQSYEELQKALVLATELGQKRAIAALESMNAKQEEAKEIVDNFVAEVKRSDKAFDEEDFFGYVQRHKIPVKEVEHLASAYSQYKEVRDAKIAAPKAPAKPADGVSAPGGGGKGAGFHVPMSQLRQSGSVFDAAADAIARLKTK